ncbi:hypothetical protein [Phyllobacterium zundukense]|uniref:Uncharacterized protein n=1 Tax=Phyllobacterium zundukense TaxID=1867719 RepID=A0ACD4CX86_9HYPH|nr:hypothetical protein [Phyllobacterium zundukense]UXN58112.1 hypothetical protein N8E88_04610 [Phyllobacterium zundukense]
MKQQGNAIRAAETYHKSGVASNYYLILVGMFVFPLILIGLVVSRGRKASSSDWARSHYELQYRSAAAVVSGVVAILLFAITIFIQNSVGLGQPANLKMWFSFLSNLYCLLFAWAVIRGVRGLFLAKSERTITNPKTYWVWPLAI